MAARRPPSQAFSAASSSIASCLEPAGFDLSTPRPHSARRAVSGRTLASPIAWMQLVVVPDDPSLSRPSWLERTPISRASPDLNPKDRD
ncbi:hypothetical protein PTTG_27428 [Puccinia triticina 1-1 BBBD Race 1]|uniref:Uncharacterized protein n=2 Tax=Puccinia triticina TaxID=208348 RepID=A0A180GKU4_PUCT1|nr:uncharacterized protein PtA15_16A330 [Puccinia triticina]OAV93088.1 hypothetical protein PTTG_27428 [Puccinia triticina 1-1 BBBD Race 1]WAQ92422.1 hypothetical protein PtA15_16A330 [Puccinia triticina]